MRKNPLANISSKGGIVTSEFLERLRGENVKHSGVLPESFAVPDGDVPKSSKELSNRITEAWKDLLERWDSISIRYNKMSISDARTKWVIPILHTLGFDPNFNRQNVVIDKNNGLTFKLSHRGWYSNDAPIIHIVSPSQDLEERTIEAVSYTHLTLPTTPYV